MRCGIDPKVDFAFKRLFGDPRTSDLTESLINAVFEEAGLTQIVDVQICNPFNLKEYPSDKLSILDVRAKDDQGRQLNLEMQVRNHSSLCSRIVYYLTEIHSTQLRERGTYEVLCPSISILIINEVLYPQIDRCLNRFQLCDKSSGIVFSDQLEILVVELPKLLNLNRKPLTRLEQWGYFFLKAEDIDMSALYEGLTVPEIKKALSELVRMNGTPEERMRYIDRVRTLREMLRWEKENAEMVEFKASMEQEQAAIEKAKAELEQAKAELEQEKAEWELEKARLAALKASLER